MIFIFGRVFDRAPDEAGLSRPALGFRDSFRRVAKTVLKIGRWRQISRRETAARGCDDLKSKASDDSCQTGVEYVSDNEGVGTGM